MRDTFVHTVAGYGCRVPLLRSLLWAAFRAWVRHHPSMRPHPLDKLYGTTTNGLLPPWLIRSGSPADNYSTVYLGCQASCVRAGLASIPQPEDRSFVDLGCGKGRALIVASELPFRRILGVELAPPLIEIARGNAKIIRLGYPERTAIEVIRADASTVPLPDGDLVIFLYHPFGQEMFARVIDRIVEVGGRTNREVFLVYENPVYGHIVDDSSSFIRWHCKVVACEADELEVSMGESDTVVVWRLALGSAMTPPSGATIPIVVTEPGWTAVLSTDSRGS